MTLTDPPDVIYLQFYGNQEPSVEPVDTADVSWCTEPFFRYDVAYVRRDIKAWGEAEMMAVILSLEGAVGRLQEENARYREALESIKGTQTK